MYFFVLFWILHHVRLFFLIFNRIPKVGHIYATTAKSSVQRICKFLASGHLIPRVSLVSLFHNQTESTVFWSVHVEKTFWRGELSRLRQIFLWSFLIAFKQYISFPIVFTNCFQKTSNSCSEINSNVKRIFS